MSKPNISIIIPTFNRVRFLTCAIDSILAQSYSDYEIIVVDDGSTDNTREVLLEYEDKIKYIYQENCGVSAARNTGIRAATGEWLAFLDSDDEWMPDYLSTQMNHIKRYPQVHMHITNSVHIQADGTKENGIDGKLIASSKDAPHVLINRPLVFIIKNRCRAYLQATVMRREMLLKVGLFNNNLNIVEDFDIVARMCLTGPIGVCDIAIVKKIRRNETLVNLTSQVGTIYGYKCLETVYDGLSKNNTLTFMEKVYVNNKLSEMRMSLGNLYQINNEIKMAKSYYRAALITSLSMKSIIKYLIIHLPKKVTNYITQSKIKR